MVEPSEIVIVVGPNGAGKSTLLKTVFGLLKPTAGDIRFEGNSISGLRPSELVKASMAFVPQVDNVFSTLTVLENLRVVEGAAKSAVDRVMDLFPVLRLRRDAKAGTLSGGERQFLAIGRALMLEPRLVLLDEPSAGLSPKMTTELFEYCSTLAKSGISFLMIEQNVLPALKICDRGYVLVAGRNTLEGTGREILENPDMREIFLGGTHA